VATNSALPVPDFLPCFIAEDLSQFEESVPELAWPPPWSLSEKETDRLLAKQNMTGVRRILDHYYGRTADLRWDAFKHLANICTKRALGMGAVWYQRPFVRFVAPLGQPKDPENYDPRYPSLRKKSTCHWFQTHIGEAITKYSSEHITKREVMELARMGDARAKARAKGADLPTLEEDDLVNVCHALVCDMADLGRKESKHELPPDPGVTVDIAAPVSEKPDYGSAVRMVVSNSVLREALPKLISKTLEAFMRKLDAGLAANEALESVAQDLNRTEQTVRNNLTKAKHIAAGVDAPALLLKLMADLVLPAAPKCHASPTAAHRSADKAAYRLPKRLTHLDGSGTGVPF
jgi:hypothetical protein